MKPRYADADCTLMPIFGITALCLSYAIHIEHDLPRCSNIEKGHIGILGRPRIEDSCGIL